MDEISSDRLEPAAGIPTAQPKGSPPEGAKRGLRRPRRPDATPPQTSEAETPAEPIPHKVDSLA